MRRLLCAVLLASLSGCASWSRLTYVSTAAVTPRLPSACETTVTFASDWTSDLRTRNGGVSPQAAALEASAKAAIIQDMASNLCGRGAAVGMEVEVRRLKYTANPYFTMFVPLPGLGWIFGLPMLSLRSEAVVVIRVKRGSAIVGEYTGTGSEHRFMSIYYGRARQPSNSSGGGIVADALQRAMEAAKTALAKDRDAVVAAAGTAGGPANGGRAFGEGRTVAVAELEANGVPATDAAVVANMLRGEMVQTGAFRMVEKANMDKVLAEQAFQQTGCTSQECAVKLGKLLNVQRMIVGSFGKLLGRYIISVRVVNVESGEVMQADEARGDTIDQLEASLKALAARLAASAR